jgi:hypothetical protein
MLVNNVILILGKVVVEEIINCSSKVRWNLPLDGTYVYCIIASILYKIDILYNNMGKQVVSPKSLSQLI